MFGSISVRNDHRDDAQLVSRTVAENRFARFTELQTLDEGEVRSVLNAAYKAGIALERKFTADDIINNESLHQAAELFAQRYDGSFSYMRDMQHDLGKWGSLSPAKAAGVLNCLMAEARKRLQTKRLASQASSAPQATGSTPVAQDEPPVVVPDGTYTVAFEDGQHRTYRLQTLRPDEAAKYGQPATAQHIALLIGADNENSFGRMGILVGRQITRRWGEVRVYDGPAASMELLSRAEAGLAVLLGAGESSLTQYGLAYALASSRCCRCGRKLTVPASIHDGMGPECASR